MKPVTILQFSPHDPPGHLESFFASRGLPFTLRRIDTGDAAPPDADAMSGLVLMGGTVSANDDAHLPWLRAALQLIRVADASGVPVLGQCLGAQLIARAFDGAVFPMPTRETGWHVLQADESRLAQEWTGLQPGERAEVFEWHDEMSAVPPGGTRLLTGRFCDNQAFVVRERHLALQPHLEITVPTIREWAHRNREEVERAVASGDSPGVQPIDAMLDDVDNRARAAHALADRLYDRWAQGLRREP